jgi:DNA-directed RNA polymerase specialized sigma24 family protein
MRRTAPKEFIYRIVSRLEKKYKEVLLLCVVEGLENREAAKILRCHPITVGTRLRRGRKMLYDILKKHGYRF